jgi:hypothetical protein
MRCRLLLSPLVLLGIAGLVFCQERPWPAQYKIRPGETNRLTAADVVGPDGIVYPDWHYAGIGGGIPDVPGKVRIEEFGAKADDERDDSKALAAAAEAVAAKGGGAVLLGPGTYHLDRPIVLMQDGIVIRGQGAEETTIVFRYGGPENQVGFFGLTTGDIVGPDTPVELHAAPEGLRRMVIEIDGQVIASRGWSKHWGGTFMLRTFGSSVMSRVGEGKRRLTAQAEYDDGRSAESSVEVMLTRRPESRPPRRLSGYGLGAITFSGQDFDGAVTKLVKDGRRGDTEIVLENASGFSPGDAVHLEAPATERWNKLVRNACQWGSYRCSQFRVEAVDGNRIRLNQPLRIDFPSVDGPKVKQIDPIRHCGVEDLKLVQTRKLWTSGILFSCAWECWTKGLVVEKAGRHPVYTRMAKWCEVRDCEFRDAWYNGGGGTAYVGWERSYDCLMEDVTTWRMRHAPCVQWSSSGNVIRNSTFHGSDAQWHAGWTNENLFENCVVDAAGSWGTYGHGGWASPPHDKAHGPQGPRNAVYNCDFKATKTGLWMGGMNENWLILHNRFVVRGGPGIYASTCSFDHIIQGNAIAVASEKQPAIRLASSDCVGVEIVGNRVYGADGNLVGGEGQSIRLEGNSLEPFTESPSRPSPQVSSIFEWQRTKRDE